MLLDQADIVVVGGGIVGLSTAYALKRRGYDVVLVEQRFLAFGASGRNSGGLWVQTTAAGPKLELMRRGIQMLGDFESELGPTFDLTRSGGLFFFETEDQRDVLKRYVDDRRGLGISADFISADEAREAGPGVPDSAIGAVYSQDDAKVSTSKFVRGLGQLARRLGIRIYENTPALSLIRSGESITGIRTVRGNVMGGGVVWCAGPWAVNLDAEGIDLPLDLVRVGLLMTQPIRATLRSMTRGPLGAAHCSALQALPGFDPAVFDPAVVQAGKPGYEDIVVQDGDGSLLVGHTLDAANSLNPHITMESSRTMIDTILQRRPEYGELGVTGLWAGIVGNTPDRLPIIDNVEGLYVNTGHSAGTGTGPFAGELMAQLVAGETPSMALETFALSRPALATAFNEESTYPYAEESV